MEKHTPTPWVYTYGAVYQGTEADVVEAHGGKLGSRDPRIIRLLLADRDTGATRPTERDANLRRVAECVNACDGIDDPTDALAKVRALLGQLTDARGNPDQLQSIMVQGYAAHAIALLGGAK